MYQETDLLFFLVAVEMLPWVPLLLVSHRSEEDREQRVRLLHLMDCCCILRVLESVNNCRKSENVPTPNLLPDFFPPPVCFVRG